MAYNEKQKQMRRCRAIKSNGERCKGYAKIGGEYCTLHSYNHRRTLPKKNERAAAAARRAKRRAQPQRRFTCNCSAFPFPHRLSSGGCRYPDPPAEVYRAEDSERAYEYEWERVINSKRDVEPSYNGAGDAEMQPEGENKWRRENYQTNEEEMSARERLMSRIWSGEFDNDD
jgi:hypothetical protein